jgi:dihydropteroate synthase
MCLTSENNSFYGNYSLNMQGNIYPLNAPKIFGILNVNNQSFYDGGRHTGLDKAVAQCQKMLDEGSDIIDIGAVSTKPGSALISHQQEWERLKPYLNELKRNFPKALFSVDTYNSATAEKAIQNGAHLINDISGGTLDTNMPKVIGELQVPYVLMHLQGTPQTMQKNPKYSDITKEVALYFSQQLDKFYARGATDIILDLGFGFGKTIQHNFTLLKQIAYFKTLFNLPVLVGLSRKSMIYKSLDLSPKEALNGTTVLNTLALQQGANFLRVHDVDPASEAIKLVTLTQN